MDKIEIKHVAVIGTGIGGLMSALALSRHNIQVTLLERDPAPDPSVAPADSLKWKRKGVPQSVHPHFFMGRLRVHLEEYYPTLVEDLVQAGCSESELTDYLHPDFLNRITAKPTDARLRSLNCRRTTYEMTVRKFAESLQGIRILSSATVTDILVSNRSPKCATGVRYEAQGQQHELAADAVIDASGRASKIAKLLNDKGIQFQEDQRDSGLWYFTRHYRLRPGCTYPKAAGLPGARFADFTGGALPSDNGYFTITLQVSREDKALAVAVRNPDHFQKVCESTHALAKWVDADRVEPTSDVYGFGQMDSFWRNIVVDGTPQILNHYFVGDSCVRSNPKYGRGCTWSTLAAHDLAELLAKDISPAERIIRFEASLEARFRSNWQTMRDIDRSTEREFQDALGLSKLTFVERIRQKANALFEDALIIEPAFFRDIWTGYHGFQNMDAWARNPKNFLRLARAWWRRSRHQDLLSAQRIRLPRSVMTAAQDIGHANGNGAQA